LQCRRIVGTSASDCISADVVLNTQFHKEKSKLGDTVYHHCRRSACLVIAPRHSLAMPEAPRDLSKAARHTAVNPKKQPPPLLETLRG